MSRRRDMDKILNSEFVSIGELVRLTGVRYSTLKFYTEEGFLPFSQEEENMTRRYDRLEAIKRVEFIRALRMEGKSIPEIRVILAAMKS